MDYKFFVQTFMLGIGLAMDACAVSMTNGLEEPKMKLPKMFLIAITFGIFQGTMPLIGYFVGNALLEYIDKFIPWIALVLLVFLGVKMIIDGFKKNDKEDLKKLTFLNILIQGIATSIDALSVGFTIADYDMLMALVCATIICLLTFSLCMISIFVGKKFGDKFENKAVIFGGIILIVVGLEIFISGIFF